MVTGPPAAIEVATSPIEPTVRPNPQRTVTRSDETRIEMPGLRRFLPLLFAGLLLAGCETPESDTPADLELEGTPGSEDVTEEPDPDSSEPEADADDSDRQAGDVFAGETLTEADITTRESTLGIHLVDGQGRTVYVFTEDPRGERTCTGSCLETWPILSTESEVPPVDGEVREELVGTIEDEDGGLQVTYDGQPLYYYTGDDAVGDLEGQGVGGQWFAVSPEGPPIDAPEAQG